MAQQTKLTVIGRNALIKVGGTSDVPAKVDTGADSSCIWASNIREKNGSLSFKLFGAGSPYYSGQEIIVEDGEYEKVRIASSSGTRQNRWAVILPVEAEGRNIKERFTLADRTTLAYPVLLGRTFLEGRFYVDVSQHIPDDVDQTLIAQKHARKRAVEGRA